MGMYTLEPKRESQQNQLAEGVNGITYGLETQNSQSWVKSTPSHTTMRQNTYTLEPADGQS